MTTDSALRELVAEMRSSVVGQPTHIGATKLTPGFISDWASQIESILAAPQAAPAGMVLVPRDATPAMVEAALAVDWTGGDGDLDAVVHNIWHTMLAAAPAPTMDEVFDQLGPAMIREVRGDVAPAAKMVEDIDPNSRNFQKGMQVGLSCEQALAEKVRNPVCDRCGARNAEEAAEKCSPSDDSCPGSEFPLTRLWELSKAAAPAAQVAEPVRLAPMCHAVIRDEDVVAAYYHASQGKEAEQFANARGWECESLFAGSAIDYIVDQRVKAAAPAVVVDEAMVPMPRDPVAAIPILRALAKAAGLEVLPDPNDEGCYPITGQQSTVRQWYDAMIAAALKGDA